MTDLPDPNRIKTITIVGGGTAGWLSAAYLNRALGDSVRIRLIESSIVGRVGVGEATVPTMVSTLRFLGIEEREFFRRCGATYKAAIKYVGWSTGGQSGHRDEFFHPFFDRPERLALPFDAPYFPFLGEGFSSADIWAQHASDQRTSFDRVSSEIPALADDGRFGKGKLPGSRTLQYAYHLDAGRFADMLAELATARGVERWIDHVDDVTLTHDGNIRGLVLRERGPCTADLFIDCSGFRGLLIGKALAEPFLDDSKFLACDAAVALPASSDPARDGVPPYTVAMAMSAGWSWRVPLFHRFGTGYVYSSAHISREAAEDELRTSLGDRAGDEATHIRMRVGRSRRSWVGNCLAVGLSSCFLEPLESTAIFLTEFQLAQFVSLFPSKRFSVARINRYNQSIADMYDHIRDFIVMHYCTTQREDTGFWQTVKNDLPIPDSLAEILEAYRAGVMPDDKLHFRLFRARSYASILSGMGVYPEFGPPILDHVDSAPGAELLEAVATRQRRAVKSFPDHYELLVDIHGES